MASSETCLASTNYNVPSQRAAGPGRSARAAIAGSCWRREAAHPERREPFRHYGTTRSGDIRRRCRNHLAGAQCRLAGGPRPCGTSQKTGLRTHQYHQPHGFVGTDQLQRYETPDPVRSNALDPPFHCVRQVPAIHRYRRRGSAGIVYVRLRRPRFRVMRLPEFRRWVIGSPPAFEAGLCWFESSRRNYFRLPQ